MRQTSKQRATSHPIPSHPIPSHPIPSFHPSFLYKTPMNVDTNISLVGYYNERVNDVSHLVNLLNLPSVEEIQTGKHSDDQNKALKRRKRDVVAVGPRTRTASYMRYKIPTAKKKRKEGITSKTAGTSPNRTLQCRQQRRTKSILRALHDMHVVTEVTCDSTDTAVLATATRWLETHFWHRKRFAMMISWNYCLPVHHNGRGLKFLRTSLSTAAVIHDASYVRPLQLIGAWSDVQRLLALFTVCPFYTCICLSIISSSAYLPSHCTND